MSVLFDGISQHGTVAHHVDFNLTNYFSISFWMRAVSLLQSQRYVLVKWPNLYTVIWEFTNNQVEFYSQFYSGSNPRTGSQIPVNDTLWHHFTYSYNGTLWEGNKDGANVFSVERDFTLNTSSDGFYMASAHGVNRFANIELFDVRIYKDYMLTQANALELFDGRGCDNVSTGTKARWKFDSETGLFISEVDLTGNGHTAIGQNDPTYVVDTFAPCGGKKLLDGWASPLLESTLLN